MKKRLLSLVSVMFLATLVSCGGGNNQSEVSIEEPVDNKVSVFVLSGQSNMEGNSYFDNGQNHLRNAFKELYNEYLP